MDWTLTILVALVVISLALGFRITRRELGTSAARRSFNATIGLFLAASAVAVAAAILYPQLFTDEVQQWIYLIFTLLFLWILLTRPLRRRRAGDVVLDLGAIPSGSRSANFFAGSSFALAGLIQGAMLLSDIDITTKDIVQITFFLVTAVYFAVRGISRTELREHGILNFDSFIRWRSIARHTWEGDNNSTLTLRLKRQAALFSFTSISIPPERREHVEELLKAHYSPEQNVQL
jgi:hypothetical protein